MTPREFIDQELFKWVDNSFGVIIATNDGGRGLNPHIKEQFYERLEYDLVNLGSCVIWQDSDVPTFNPVRLYHLPVDLCKFFRDEVAVFVGTGRCNDDIHGKWIMFPINQVLRIVVPPSSKKQEISRFTYNK